MKDICETDRIKDSGNRTEFETGAVHESNPREEDHIFLSPGIRFMNWHNIVKKVH